MPPTSVHPTPGGNFFKQDSLLWRYTRILSEVMGFTQQSRGMLPVLSMARCFLSSTLSPETLTLAQSFVLGSHTSASI